MMHVSAGGRARETPPPSPGVPRGGRPGRRARRAGRVVRILVLSVTSLGLALGLAGAYLLPSPAAALLLLASLCVDGVDGWLARRVDAVSDAGGWLDWSTDTALSYAIAYRVLATWPVLSAVCTGALVVLQAGSRAVGRRASGRTVVTLVAVGWVLVEGIP